MRIDYTYADYRTYTYEDWEKIRKFFDEMDIPYDEGESYGDGEIITGHWIRLAPTEIVTREISEEDKMYNES